MTPDVYRFSLTIPSIQADAKTTKTSPIVDDEKDIVLTWWANSEEPRDTVTTRDVNGKYLEDWTETRIESYPVDYTTNIKVTGKINWNDENLYKDALRQYIELMEGCDIDCQKTGSGLTIVAILNATSLGFIGLNALFMFIGTWRYRFRVCSVYCTIFSCMFQFAILITSATFLFNKYSTTLCMRSLAPTAGGLMWTMADDYATNVSLWFSQFFLMFGFLICGFCSAYKAEN